MKRDMDLVRLTLLANEGDEGAKKEIAELRKKEGGREAVFHHRDILVDAGYLVFETETLTSMSDMNAPSVTRMTPHVRLTWQGHEFLDSMRDDTVWKKAKETVIKPGASWTVSLLVEWLKYEARAKLGFPHS